jgi:signal transduction histidine kinase
VITAVRRIRAEYALLVAALMLMVIIIGTGVYESYRAKQIDLIGKSEAFFVSSRALNDFDRLTLAATRARLRDPDLTDELQTAFDITNLRIQHLEIETAGLNPESRFLEHFASAKQHFDSIEKIMLVPDCDDACIGNQLIPVLKRMHRSLLKMRGAGLQFEVDSRDYMTKLHTEIIRKIYFTAGLFTLLAALSMALLKRQNTNLRREMSRAEESERRVLEVSDYRAQFLAGMSHEFRTPLNAIKGFSQFLMMPDVNLPEKVRREYIADIEKSARDLEGMTDTVLDLAKIDAGTFELYEERIDLSEVIEDVARQFTGDGERLNVTAPDSLNLICDEAAIKRCIQNLVSNALKFSDEAVNLTLTKKTTGIEICVRDRGVGIPADEINDVWVPYRRSTETRSSDKQGTGLGLPITKELVAVHGGKINLESEVGKGTAVTITLPISMLVSTSAPAAEAGSGFDAPTSHNPRAIASHSAAA